ncbi:MAG: hypothetical protein H8E86_09100 [Planctomycetes bacterium]|nr:hypothetical protein [Planctomycetota bacterium]
MLYKHTQKAVLVMTLLAMSIALCLVVAGTNGWNTPVGYSLYVVIFLLSVLLWLFGSLTVEVSGEELRHSFGPGFWKKKYLLSDIEKVETVRNSWIYGWGIRLTPHGWLYNVSGLDAVEITLRSGRKFRIGSDDTSNLVSTLASSIC